MSESIEDKYNKLLVEHNDIQEQLKTAKESIDFMTKQYNSVVNVMFNKLFDLAAEVKNQRLSNILPQTQ